MKKKKEFNEWKRVSILWIDSVDIRLNKKSWHHYDEIKDHMSDLSGHYMMTTGYQFYENDDYITLARDISFEENNAALFGGIISIPKGCIKKIKNL